MKNKKRVTIVLFIVWILTFMTTRIAGAERKNIYLDSHYSDGKAQLSHNLGREAMNGDFKQEKTSLGKSEVFQLIKKDVKQGKDVSSKNKFKNLGDYRCEEPCIESCARHELGGEACYNSFCAYDRNKDIRLKKNYNKIRQKNNKHYRRCRKNNNIRGCNTR